MSRITTVYNQLITELSTLYPEGSGYFRLGNSYKPEENADIFLVKGWGVSILPASNTEREINCKFSLDRQINIVFSRKYDALEQDPASKATSELALLEDQYALINELEQNPTLNDTVTLIKWLSDSGIEYVRGETDRFLMLRNTVSIEYLEPFT